MRAGPTSPADAGALCLKAGNPVILRGGSDSLNSSSAIHACLVEGLKAADLPEDSIQLVPMTDRAAVGEMLAGLDGNLDVIIPRGGKSLVGRVQKEARVPVFAHLEGICHLYIDRSAKLDMATQSPSTPRCAAPASAARPRRCWSTARSPRRISCRSSKRSTRPVAKSAARPKCLPPSRGRSPRPTPTGRPNISTRSSR